MSKFLLKSFFALLVFGCEQSEETAPVPVDRSFSVIESNVPSVDEPVVYIDQGPNNEDSGGDTRTVTYDDVDTDDGSLPEPDISGVVIDSILEFSYAQEIALDDGEAELTLVIESPAEDEVSNLRLYVDDSCSESLDFNRDDEEVELTFKESGVYHIFAKARVDGVDGELVCDPVAVVNVESASSGSSPSLVSDLEFKTEEVEFYTLGISQAVTLTVDDLDSEYEVEFFADSGCSESLVSERDGDEFEVKVTSFGELTLYASTEEVACGRAVNLTINNPESICEAGSDEVYGSGTSADPYVLCDGLALKNLNLTKNYVIGSDLDLESASDSAKGWLPLGWSSNELTDFSGVLDGRGHVIYNFSIDRQSNYMGLFASIRGEVKNLVLGKSSNQNCEPDCSIRGSNYTGALAGVLKGGAKISNIINNNSISAKNYVGGVVGGIATYSASEYTVVATNLENRASITGDSRVGGIVGFINDGSRLVVNLDLLKNTEEVSSTYYAGGIVGTAGGKSELDISNARNSGKITSSYAGGIISEIQAKAVEIDSVWNSGKIDLNSSGSGGGIVANVRSKLVLKKALNTGDLSGVELGGIIGNASEESGSVSLGEVKNEGDIGDSDTNTAGGIFGMAGGVSDSISVEGENLENAGSLSVSSNGNFGGLFGASSFKAQFDIEKFKGMEVNNQYSDTSSTPSFEFPWDESDALFPWGDAEMIMGE